jgi:GDSL-like Lipase/Acylhydrolase family
VFFGVFSQKRHKYKTLVLRVAMVVIVFTVLCWLLYMLFGRALMTVIYESDVALVKKFMPGKLVTPLENYLAIADDLVFTTALALMLAAFLATVLVLNPANTILALCSLALCFLVAEIGARLAFRNVTTTAAGSSYLDIRWRRNIPKNTRGFREREFQREKPKHVYRIAVIGDSLTWGQGIAEEDRFSNRIEQWLNQTSATYEVLNFGRPGADTADELEILNNEVLPLKPDFVLLQWYTNDAEPRDESWLKSGIRLIPSNYFSRLFRRNSLLFWLLENRWGALQDTLGLRVFFEDPVLAEFADPYGVAWTEAETTLWKFINSCKQQGVPIGIVLFSDSYYRQSKLDFLTDRVLKICEESLTPCLDLRQAFASYKDDARLWASRLDPHPSALANLIATEQIIERFREIWLNRAVRAIR